MPLGFQSHTKPLDFENHLNGFPGRNILPPMPPSASAAGGLCRTETSLLVGERAFPATLGRGRGKAQLGLCSDPLPLVLSCHAPGSKESSVGAACMLSSGQGCTCLLTSWVNNSVSPVAQMWWPMCPCAQSRAAMSAQTKHHTSLHETWQPWECQNIFHVPLPGGWAEPKQEAGTAPATLPRKLERD